MGSMDEFRGKTEEAITTVKQDVAEVKRKVDAIDKRIWLLILLVLGVLVQDQNITSGLVGKILAFGK